MGKGNAVRSPLKGAPLNNPGESIDRKINQVLEDTFAYYFIAFMFVAIAALEWYRHFSGNHPGPVITTAIAVIGLTAFIWKVVRTKREIGRLKLGRDGEKQVGHALEKLREIGASVFHDIPGEGFNIDHIVVHPTGVYVVETKTRSKPARGPTKLIYDGEAIYQEGNRPWKAPIEQVRGASKWLADYLRATLGRPVAVRPVVLYPGWFIDRTPEGRKSDVWVLHPDGMPSFIEKCDAKHSTEEVGLISSRIALHVTGAVA